MKTPANIAAAARLARRRAERLTREAAAPARRPAHNIYLLPKREKPTASQLGNPPADIPDVGGYDNNGNPL